MKNYRFLRLIFVVKNLFLKKKYLFLRLISGAETLSIGPLDGKRLIKDAKSVFGTRIPPLFDSRFDDKVKPTPKTLFDVYELKKDATFLQIFYDINPDLRKSVMTQDQIISFCEEYSKWLNQKGDFNFFLTESKGYFYVILISKSQNGFRLHPASVHNGIVWPSSKEGRVVAPKLEP